MGWGLAWTLGSNIILFLITIMVGADTRLRLDRIAGRIAGGAVESSVDAFLYGHTLQPVFLPSGRAKAKEEAEAKVEPQPQPVAELS